MKIFSEQQHEVFETIMQKRCKNLGPHVVSFFLDVLQFEIFVRILMDLKKISYFDAEELMRPKRLSQM